jgi:phage terminase large subunit GpA-like protein
MIDRNVPTLAAGIAECFRPRPVLTGVEYADTYGHVTGNAASKGPWITRPYQAYWFYAFASRRVPIFVCMKSARVGWSESVKIGAVQYYAHWKPSKVMVVQPIEKDAEEYSKEDVSDLFADTPCLDGLLSESKSRGTATNTILLKKLTNGALIDIVNAKSGKSFRRKERPVVIFEEPSAYDRINEGCQIKLGIRRTETSWSPKVIIGGTPIFPNDKTHQWFLRGDQQYRYLPCPHCRHYQPLRWEAMAKEGPKVATFECENCQEAIEYTSLREMDAQGGWACPLGLDRSQQSLTPEGEPAVESQYIWAAYSYHAGAVWRHLIAEYQEALEAMRRGDTDPMHTYHNTVLGIPWEDSIAGKLTCDGLAERRKNIEAGNGYAAGTVPNGVLMITAGVDVQGGGGTANERVVVTVWGWGRGEEGWHLGHWEIDGDPQQAATLEQLSIIAATKWRRDDGAQIPLAMGAIDDGGTSTQEVRGWCRGQGGVWVPVKGAGTKGLPLVGRGRPVDINHKNQPVQKKGLMLYQVGYDTSVSHLQGRLRNEIPGPGYLHFGEGSTDQFLAELFPWKRVPRRKDGHVAYHWECPTGMRDEAGDCTRYAYAALQLVSRRYNRQTMWDQLEAQLTGAPAVATIERKKGSWLTRSSP